MSEWSQNRQLCRSSELRGLKLLSCAEIQRWKQVKKEISIVRQVARCHPRIAHSARESSAMSSQDKKVLQKIIEACYQVNSIHLPDYVVPVLEITFTKQYSLDNIILSHFNSTSTFQFGASTLKLCREKLLNFYLQSNHFAITPGETRNNNRCCTITTHKVHLDQFSGVVNNPRCLGNDRGV